MDILNITHEFVNFNAEHLAKKSEEEFLAEFENTKVYKDFSPQDRAKLLKEAYSKCREAALKAGKPVYEQPVASQEAVEQSVTEQAPPERPGRKPAGEKN